MSKKRTRSRKPKLAETLDEAMQKDTINPAELGRRVAATMFAAFLNPQHRFLIGNWKSFASLAGDRAEGAAKKVIGPRVSGKQINSISLAMRRAAVQEARRLVEDSGVEVWCAIPPAAEKCILPPSDKALMDKGEACKRSENEDKMEVLHDDGTFKVLKFCVRIPDGEEGAANNGDYYQFIGVDRVTQVQWFEAESPFPWQDWGKACSKNFIDKANARLEKFQGALAEVNADIEAIEGYEGWVTEDKPGEAEAPAQRAQVERFDELSDG